MLVDERVRDLLGRMTVEEKLGQLACLWAPKVGSVDEVVDAAPGGVAWFHSATASDPRTGARLVNEIQRRLVEATRLGIPTLFNEEGLCGLKVPAATVFPDAIAQAATWDPGLVESMARSIGRQMVHLGVRQVLSPLCDVARDPRWGRIEETYGEDPYLVGVMACAFVRGVQEADADHPVAATLKHFIGYAASEGGRNLHAAHLGQRELREVHGVPFEMAIRAANARAVMCSYNQVDHVPVQASRPLLTDLLRGEYGFDGMIISDLNSVAHLHELHGVSENATTAIVTSLDAGLDLELADPVTVTGIAGALADGSADLAEVDRAVANVLRLKFELGLFESPYVDEDRVPETLESRPDRDLARTVAERAIVLLQNELVDGAPLLPVGEVVRSIAVIGPNADRPFGLLGNYTFPVLDSAVRWMNENAIRAIPGHMDAGDRRRSADEAAPLVDVVPIVTVLDGIRDRAAPGIQVRYARGCPVEDVDRSGFAEAVELARGSDLALVVVGDQSGLASAATVGESVDSAGCQLPGVQRELVEAVVAAGTPTVVVLTHGRPFVLEWMTASVPAILTAWFPGEEGGNAVAAALFGDINPGGKTPVSFPAHAGMLPAPYNRTRLGGTYYDATVDDVFPFGHGLSYTTFDYRDLEVTPGEVPSDGVVRVSCTVENTGDRPGDEVVQLYVHDPVARSSRPRRELKGFHRLSLDPGASARVTFNLATDRVSLCDPGEGWLVEPGRIEVLVGSSSQDIRLQGAFMVTGDVRYLPGDRELFTPVTVETR